MSRGIFNIRKLNVSCCAAIVLLLWGCGFDFNRNFNDSDDPSTTDTSTVGDTESDTERPDFSLMGFAAVEPGTIGGQEGAIVTAIDAVSLTAYLESEDPYVIQVSSVIPLDASVDVLSDKTIKGVGDQAGISGHGLSLSNVSNIIIRNLTFSGISDDAISIKNNAHHIWIDHNDFSNTTDGLVDITLGASYITVSWNHFHDQDKVCLIGASDTDTTDEGKLKVTVHHNWFDHTTQQHPRCRFGEIHVLNNFYDTLSEEGYGITSTTEAKVLSEANSFLNVAYPFLLSGGDSPAGNLVSKNDYFKECGELIENGEAFDPSEYYPYSPDSALSVAGMVQDYAGVGVVEVTDQ